MLLKLRNIFLPKRKLRIFGKTLSGLLNAHVTVESFTEGVPVSVTISACRLSTRSCFVPTLLRSVCLHCIRWILFFPSTNSRFCFYSVYSFAAVFGKVSFLNVICCCYYLLLQLCVLFSVRFWCNMYQSILTWKLMSLVLYTNTRFVGIID